MLERYQDLLQPLDQEIRGWPNQRDSPAQRAPFPLVKFDAPKPCGITVGPSVHFEMAVGPFSPKLT